MIRNLIFLLLLSPVAAFSTDITEVPSTDLDSDSPILVDQVDSNLNIVNLTAGLKPKETIQILEKKITSSASRFDSRAAVVDVESILEHSLAIEHIKRSIISLREKMEGEFSSKELGLKKIEADLIKQRGVLSSEDFEKKVAEFNKKVSIVQQEMQSKKVRLEHAHAASIAKVHNNTIAVIRDLSKKHGFNIVFPSSQVLYVNNDLNITLEVITNLNERLKEVKVKYDSEE